MLRCPSIYRPCTAILIAIAIFAAQQATIVSGFSSQHHAPISTSTSSSQQDLRHAKFVQRNSDRSSAPGKARRQTIASVQAARPDHGNKDNNEQNVVPTTTTTTTGAANNVIWSRRQALAAFAVSAATVAALPPTAEASFTEKTIEIATKQHGDASPEIIQSAENAQSVSSRSSFAGMVSESATRSCLPSSLTSSSAAPSSIQESLSEFIAGASVAGVKTVVKFPLDTATVRVQMPNSEYTIRDPLELFNGCYNGISLTLLSNLPAGAVFFGVKDAVKNAIRQSDHDNTVPRWLSTSLAVCIGQVPYWLLRNPSEVVKVRQQTNVEGYGGDVSAIDAVKQTFQGSGCNSSNEGSNKGSGGGGVLSDFYTGYWENILYACPADVIKFVAYESVTKGRKDLSPIEGARAGALATAVAQIVTTPLDVVRNRLMLKGKTNKINNGSSPLQEGGEDTPTNDDDDKSGGYIESLITLGKEEGWRGLFAGATPRASKAILSGAIQFATYEETKQSMSKMMLRQR